MNVFIEENIGRYSKHQSQKIVLVCTARVSCVSEALSFNTLDLIPIMTILVSCQRMKYLNI